MKLNISYPQTGQQKLIEINDEQKLHPFMDKRIGDEVEGSTLGDEYKGYIFKISGGNDKQGFPMKQGILTANRVRVLLKKGEKCYRPRRSGERKRKSVRGCITSNELCVLDLVIVKKGAKELAGVTDEKRSLRHGPKRAGKIRKIFQLTKDQDVRRFVVRRTVKNNRKRAPKIQRLVTPLRIARKKYLERQKVRSAIKTRTQLVHYKKLVSEMRKKAKDEQLEKLRKQKSKAESKKAKKANTQKKTEKKEEKKDVKKDAKKEVKKEVKKDTKKEEKKDVKKEVKKETTRAALVAASKQIKKPVAKKTETKPVETKKADAKKAAPAKKVETKKAEPKKVEAKKVDAKKADAKKAAPAKKVETKKVETKKAEPKKVEAKKAAPAKKVETKAAPKNAKAAAPAKAKKGGKN